MKYQIGDRVKFKDARSLHTDTPKILEGIIIDSNTIHMNMASGRRFLFGEYYKLCVGNKKYLAFDNRIIEVIPGLNDIEYYVK